MKNVKIRSGVLSIAAVMLMTFSACDDAADTNATKSQGMQDETVAADSAAAVTAAKKKKGRASAGKADADASTAKTNKPAVKKDKDGVYTMTEIMPLYPGNEQSMSDFISNNITYPQRALDNNIEGTVFVEFVIDEKGTISDVKTTGTQLGYGLEEEAVSVVNKLQGWTPGKVKGKNVKTRLNVPITYKLED